MKSEEIIIFVFVGIITIGVPILIYLVNKEENYRK